MITISHVLYTRSIIMRNKEGFTTTQKPTMSEQIKEILKKASPSGEDIQALQGAYEQFLILHRNFCSAWSPFLETAIKYEKQSSNETENGGAAVGMGTLNEYVRLIGLREKKTFVDCSVEFPAKLDVGITSQQMPYESKAYLDSLDYGIKQLTKIQEDTKKALTNIPAGTPGSQSGTTSTQGSSTKAEGFLDIISQNCEEINGIIRCVLSIDATNKNIKGRAMDRLAEILEKEQTIRTKLIQFQKELTAVEQLKEKAESGKIVEDITITI